MTFRFPKSAQLYGTGGKLIPAGVSSNTRARAPHPIYFERANGCYATDVDGNQFIDILMGNGAILLGHNCPEVQEAVRLATTTGLTTGVESTMTVALADKFLSIVKTMDMVRFTNTGTEAVMHALRLARFATGRKQIAKVEGSYHGWGDEAFISVWPDLSKAGTVEAIKPLPGSPGQREDVVSETLILPFNDIENSIAAIERHAEALAAVILEPILIDIGFIPATKAYLQALRDVCDKHGIILIFDELLTAFNVAPGGVQQIHSVIPDLATYGKALGNGYPIAALAGREHLMSLTAPGRGPVFVGTFNGHAVCVAAALAALALLADGSVAAAINRRLAALTAGFHDSAAKIGIAAFMQGQGSHFQWYFTEKAVTDYRSAATSNAAAYRAFVQSLFEQGTLVLPNPLSHHALSAAHDDSVIERLIEIFSTGLKAAAASNSG
jgi:glutamate-1-semialdehyde 2,1-aminomutase